MFLCMLVFFVEKKSQYFGTIHGITCDYLSFALYSNELKVIQVEYFLLKVSIKLLLFPFLTYSILFETCGFPQSIFEFDINMEVPLPPFYYSHSNHIEDNAQFGWGV